MSAAHRSHHARHSIVLLGPPGAGKSTCGPLLARTLGWPCTDLDDVIAQCAALPLAMVFARGERAFRELELHALVASLHAAPSVVVAGAGVVDGARACTVLAQVQCVTLHVPAAVALTRLSPSSRPWLPPRGPRAQLRAYVERERGRPQRRARLGGAVVDANASVERVVAAVVRVVSRGSA